MSVFVYVCVIVCVHVIYIYMRVCVWVFVYVCVCVICVCVSKTDIRGVGAQRLFVQLRLSHISLRVAQVVQFLLSRSHDCPKSPSV